VLDFPEIEPVKKVEKLNIMSFGDDSNGSEYKGRWAKFISRWQSPTTPHLRNDFPTPGLRKALFCFLSLANWENIYRTIIKLIIR
jgi:hypothetical protein